MTTDLFRWIGLNLQPVECTTPELIYDDLESQSGRSLPIIYQPFDVADRGHWRDRGSLFDFLLSCAGPGAADDSTPLGRVLDFGPGDGWPSLLLAPFAREIVGVDASARRVDVCRENARRLELGNATFVHVPPGERLPFGTADFDAVTAASSVEQSPDPRSTLAELCRVLRPGGRLRITFESLEGYRGGGERDFWLAELVGGRSRLVLFDRRPDEEFALNYGLTFRLPRNEIVMALGGASGALTFEQITPERLAALGPDLVDARGSRTVHPTGRTLIRWLREVGFGAATSTHSGATFAGLLFDRLPSNTGRPTNLADLDALLRPLVGVIVDLPAPPGDYPITAVKQGTDALE